MTLSSFAAALRSGRVLLMDGAMGTELQRAGLPDGACYEHWDLTHPDRVRAIHEAYVAAGAEVLLTNTFQANPIALARHGLAEELSAIQAAALRLARSACPPGGFVLGDLGPLLSPPGAEEFRDRDVLQGTVRGLVGADALLFETCSSPRVWDAVRWAQQVAGCPPLLLSFTYEKPATGEPRTHTGQGPEGLARQAERSGVIGLGVNCGRDLDMPEIVRILRRYREHTDLPLFARPNAGTPVRVGDRWVYPHTPEVMAAHVLELLAAGVSLIGGCCGTTPAHVAALRPLVVAWNARHGPGDNRP